MKTVTVSGHTFQHRDTLKELGGRWDADAQNWRFAFASPALIAALKELPGCLVTDNRPLSPRPITPPAIPTTPAIVGDDMTYYNYFVDQDPIAYFGFSSLSKFAEHVASLEKPTNGIGGLCDIGWTATQTYTGTDSMAQALDIARNGWLDGLGMMKQMFTQPPIGKNRIRSVSGGSVSVGRMLAGMPDHMYKRKKQPKHKIITIFVETCMWEGISAGQAMLRVTIIAAMIDRLEAEGYSCNLVATYCARQRDNSRGVQTIVRIKEAGESLNLADVSFAFGHPSYGRRLVYAIEGCTPQCDLTRHHRGKISEAFDEYHKPGKNEFYIPQINRNGDGTIADMINQLQPEGLPVELKVI